MNLDEIIGGSDEYFIFEDERHLHVGTNPRQTLVLDSSAALARLKSLLDFPDRGIAVGFLGYGVARWLEKLPDRHPRMPIPDGKILFFDHVTTVDREPSVIPSEARDPGGGQTNWKTNQTRDQFLEAVRYAKDAISAGEAFQIVVSQRWETEFPAGDAVALYRALRRINPSPYMFLLKMRECILVGCSPEMLVRVNGGVVETRPIAGTRPRGRDQREDQALENELLANEKENAEHLMLVDLGRNDVGRVSKRGSVRVTEFRTVERYSDVMHLVSHVKGELRDGLAPIDALVAAFPAGTVSGAPKIRAMELIDELEFSRRGPYAGAILYSESPRSLDSCITIRTILLQGGRAWVQAGAGVVFDSDPAAEFDETMNKAAALKRAVEACHVEATP